MTETEDEMDRRLEALKLAALTDDQLRAAWTAAPAASDDLALVCGEFERRGLDEPFPW